MDIKIKNAPGEIYLHKFFLWKNLIDKTGSFIGQAILSPVFIIVALLIKAAYPGPVFLKQTRTGWEGKAFLRL